MSYITAKAIGETLALARVNAGLSQQEMAKRIDRSKATVQSWESGCSSPRCDEMLDWFSTCGVSPLAYFQAMLYPELYAAIDDDQTDEQVEEALARYFHNAPPIVKRMMLFVVLGEHGSYPPAVISEMCANLHTPLQNRVAVCGQVVDNYRMAQAAHTDPMPHAIQPPIDDLEQTYLSGKKAALKGSQAYIAKGMK